MYYEVMHTYARYAITDESESGMMSTMTTITHNDNVPEILANLRRGPFAQPTEDERIAYLMTRVRTGNRRPAFEDYGLEHVLSYQRRINATKESFMKRNKITPLGILIDWWDRTEAQMRAIHICVDVFIELQ